MHCSSGSFGRLCPVSRSVTPPFSALHMPLLITPEIPGSHTKHAAYGALYLVVPGVYSSAPVIAAWISNNSEPHYTRATSIAVGLGATNIVSVFWHLQRLCVGYLRFCTTTGRNIEHLALSHSRGPKIPQNYDHEPRIVRDPSISRTYSVWLRIYPNSQVGIILLAVINAVYLNYQNKNKKANRAQILGRYDTSKHADGGVWAWVDLGDRHPDFHYMLWSEARPVYDCTADLFLVYLLWSRMYIYYSFLSFYK